MTLLEKHRHDYRSLTKKDLILIIEEQLDRNMAKISRNKYDPINSIRNNNRRALRKLLKKRHELTSKDKIYEKIRVLRGIVGE